MRPHVIGQDCARGPSCANLGLKMGAPRYWSVEASNRSNNTVPNFRDGFV